MSRREAMLIGVGGRKEHGKDAFARGICDGSSWQLLGMSDPLMDAAIALNPSISVTKELGLPGTAGQVPLSELVTKHGWTTAKRVPEVRAFLIRLGTVVGRGMIGEDIWVNIARRKIVALLERGVNVAITGIRFPNELEMVQQLGGHTVWVHRPGVEPDALSNDVSERSVDMFDFDHVIDNDGSIEQLHERAQDLLRNLQESDPGLPLAARIERSGS